MRAIQISFDIKTNSSSIFIPAAMQVALHAMTNDETKRMPESNKSQNPAVSPAM